MSYAGPYYIQEQNQEQTLRSLARGVFYLGALASTMDAVTTYIVLHRAGLQHEQNPLMHWLMETLGLGVTCGLRALFGILIFAYVANMLIGRRYYFQRRRALKYRDWVQSGGGNRFNRWVIRHRPGIMAMEVIFILGITCAVVGNNIDMLVRLLHG